MENRRLSKSGCPHFYDIAFRRKVAMDYENTLNSFKDVSKKYNISDHSVKRWVLDYRQEQENLINLQEMQTTLPQEDNNHPDDPEQYRELKKRLEDAEFKVLALETMIDIAEERFDIDIRKKPGTKASRK